MENYTDLYATLVNEAEARTKDEHRPTRFEMLSVLEDLGVTLNRDSIDLVEKLYADGFVAE